MAKGLKLRDRKFWGLITTFVEVTEEKLVGAIVFSPPPGIRGGNDFCVISQGGEQLLNFKSQRGDTFRGGEIILGS